MKSVEELEYELQIAAKLSARMEKLKERLPEYFENQRKIFDAFDNLNSLFMKHLEEDRKFLESLPAKVQRRIDNDKAILELKKEILELLKSSE